jgi:aminocarboxymuconate-semialdehyde decarboxylase
MHIDMDTHYTPFEALRRLDGKFGADGLRFAQDPRVAGDEVIYYHKYTHRKNSSIPDLKKRLADMDIAQFDKQVLICGSRLTYYETTPEMGLEICRACNDGSAEAMSYSDRFIGAAIVPLQDVALAVNELERAITKLGLKAVNIATNVNGKLLDAPELKLFYKKVSELNVPILVHGVSDFMCYGIRQIDKHPPFSQVRLTGVLGFPFEMQIVISSLILGGILDEFPNLRFCFLEGGVGFFAHLMDRLTGDAYAWLTSKSEEQRKNDQKMRDLRDAAGNREEIVKEKLINKPPEEYIQSLYLSVEVFEKLLPYTIQTYGSANLVLGSDYPHPDTFFPYTVPRLMDVKSISAQDKEKIAGRNAQRLLNL